MTRVAITAAAATAGGALSAALEWLPEPVRQRAQRSERLSQLTLAVVGRALGDAGHACLDAVPRPAFGIALGTAFGCFLTNAAYQRRLALDGVRGASPRLFAATVSNAAAGEAGIAYRLGGPAVTLTAGTAAGLLAVGHAADLVADGRAELMVAGGVDAEGPDLERWLADGGLPLGGASMREGAAVLVLERTPAGRPLGWIAGHAGGFLPPGEADAAAALAARALEDAGATAADVGLTALAGARGAVVSAERALRPILGDAIRRVPPERGDAGAAGGPLALVDALAAAPAAGVVLVLQVCPSGHAAALVAAPAGGR